MGERRSSEGQQSPLRNDRGATRISDTVVQKIAGIAAQEVEKIQMGGGTGAAVSGFLGSMTSAVTGNSGGGPAPTTGVSVEVGQEEAAVDLTVAVEYGTPIPQTTEAVRRNVINRVENLTGLRSHRGEHHGQRRPIPRGAATVGATAEGGAAGSTARAAGLKAYI
jgi:uncharacterized alkaline shock family protein YloU